MAAALLSMAPATTWTYVGRPRCSAALSESVPMTSVQAHDRRQLGAVDAAVVHQGARVPDAAGAPVVGDPRGQDRVHCGHRAAGELQVDPVEHVEECRGALVHLGHRVADQQHVRGRVLARRRRHAAGQTQPAHDPPYRHAVERRHAAELAAQVGRAAHVQPRDARGQRLAVRVHRDRAFALGRRADGGDGPQVLRGGRGRGRPPPRAARSTTPPGPARHRRPAARAAARAARPSR